MATTARCQNNGQSCIAAKRFIVHTDVYDAFAAAFVEKMSALVVGDPMDDDTDIGPLATEQGRDDVADQVARRGRQGRQGAVRRRADRPARLVVPADRGRRAHPGHADVRRGGLRPGGRAVPGRRPTTRRSQLANGTDFGLGSNAWTTDPDEQDAFIRDLEAGAVFINGMTTSFNELPFGGVKNSGYGRELSAHGIREFCNAKSVWIGETEATRAGPHSE